MLLKTKLSFANNVHLFMSVNKHTIVCSC